jgi:flagellar hook-length control protein FliK
MTIATVSTSLLALTGAPAKASVAGAARPADPARASGTTGASGDASATAHDFAKLIARPRANGKTEARGGGEGKAPAEKSDAANDDGDEDRVDAATVDSSATAAPTLPATLSADPDAMAAAMQQGVSAVLALIQVPVTPAPSTTTPGDSVASAGTATNAAISAMPTMPAMSRISAPMIRASIAAPTPQPATLAVPAEQPIAQSAPVGAAGTDASVPTEEAVATPTPAVVPDITDSDQPAAPSTTASSTGTPTTGETPLARDIASLLDALKSSFTAPAAPVPTPAPPPPTVVAAAPAVVAAIPDSAKATTTPAIAHDETVQRPTGAQPTSAAPTIAAAPPAAPAIAITPPPTSTPTVVADDGSAPPVSTAPESQASATVAPAPAAMAPVAASAQPVADSPPPVAASAPTVADGVAPQAADAARPHDGPAVAMANAEAPAPCRGERAGHDPARDEAVDDRSAIDLPMIDQPAAIDSAALPQAVTAAPAASTDAKAIDAAMAQANTASPTEQAVARHLDLAHDTQWMDQLAKDISQAAATNGQLKFHLNPENLGSLAIEVRTSAEGTSIRMTTETDHARTIIADAQPRLIAEVRAQGLRVAESHVDLGNQNASGSTAGQQQQQQRQSASDNHKPFAATQTVTRDESADSRTRDDDERYA